MTQTLAELMPLAASLSPTSGIADAAIFYSWPEADRITQAVARRLRIDGVQPQDRVVILHPKSAVSFLAMHSVLRAGAVAVPIDPLGPPETIASIIESVEPRIIITADQTWSRAMAPPSVVGSAKVVLTDIADDADPGVSAHSYFSAVDTTDNDPLPLPSPDRPAYIIFTSGSTGRPKGIVHTHTSSLAYTKHAVNVHRLDERSVLAGTSPFHFDISTFELYGAPFVGSTVLTLGERDLLFMTSLAKLLVEHSVTHLYAVPYMLKQMMAQGIFEAHDFSNVRQISFGGEQFSPGSLRRLTTAMPYAEFLNVYGPAEVNGVITHSFGIPTATFTEVPIGTAWPGITTRIVDSDGQPVLQGTTGELLVNSQSAMQGYWNMPDRTAMSFVDEDGVRFYRTGDRVHVDAEGLLHFHGRNDNRVKVRGIRLELEEVEQVVGDAPGVDAAAVGIVEADGREYIHAWLILADQADLDHAEIVSWCRGRLPSAAVPAQITVVQSLPTTQSGKVDRHALVAQLAEPEATTDDE